MSCSADPPPAPAVARRAERACRERSARVTVQPVLGREQLLAGRAVENLRVDPSLGDAEGGAEGAVGQADLSDRRSQACARQFVILTAGLRHQDRELVAADA